MRRSELHPDIDYAWAQFRYSTPVRVRLADPVEPGWTTQRLDDNDKNSPREWVQPEPNPYRTTRITRVRAWLCGPDGTLGNKLTVEPRDITMTWAEYEVIAAERKREREAADRAHAQLVGEQIARFDELAALGIDVRASNWRSQDTTLGSTATENIKHGPYLRGRYVILTFDQLDRLIDLAHQTDPTFLANAVEPVLASRPKPEIVTVPDA